MATATYDLIASQTLGSAASSITFSSIAASWTDLRLVITGTVSSAGANIGVSYNNDSTTSYSQTQIGTTGSIPDTRSSTSQTYIPLDTVGGWDTTIPCTINVNVFSYAGSTYKTLLANASEDLNGSGVTIQNVGLWRNTAAITVVKFSCIGANFKTNTTAQLYGIKAA